MKTNGHCIYDGTEKSLEFVKTFLNGVLEFCPSGKVRIEAKEEGRSLDQNALKEVWYNDVSKESGEMGRDVKRYCKLHFGVPILRGEDEDFRAFYDSALKSKLSYEEKLQAMDYMPVTSLMSTSQMTRYLSDMQKHYAEQSVVLRSMGDYSDYREEA